MDVKNIKELVQIVLHDQDNLHIEFSFGSLSRKQAKIIENSIGIDLTSAAFIIDSYSIRHTLLSHSNAIRESNRGQIAVTPADFSLIPTVIQAPDTIEYAGKNKMQQDVFKYKKRIDALYISAVRARQQNGVYYHV